MKKLLSVFFIPLLFLAASCQKSELNEVVNTDNFIQVQQASIASVNGPTTGAINDTISITISWPYSGNCEKFSSFKVDTLSDTTQIKLFTSTNVAEDCTGKEVDHSQTYKFVPTKTGTYYLKFAGPKGARPIVDTLVVK